MSKWRIVRDSYAGYSVDVWRWWFPIWIEKGGANTFSTIEAARDYALTGGVVESGEL